MAVEEEVLVIERSVLEEIGIFQGLEYDVAKYTDKIFASGVTKYMLRKEVEEDPSYKQLIPYVIIKCGGKYLNYVRGKRAGETRLIGNRSIGIGGHINPVDDMPLFGGPYDAYLGAVEREIDEEVAITAKRTNKIVALLNDDSNEVGKVHLGVVHIMELSSEDVARKEQMITQLNFMTLNELNEVKDSMETWSGLCLELLAKIENEG